MTSMLAGGLLAKIGVRLPGVEYGIMTSVLVLGLLVAATGVIPLKYGAALVALFAAFHGHAHAVEMVQGGSMAAYAVGFLLATAVLHAGGVAGGLILARLLDSRAAPIGGRIDFAGGAADALRRDPRLKLENRPISFLQRYCQMDAEW